MSTDKNIEQLVQETLNSLDGVQRAEANPYLYTRVQQALRPLPSQGIWSKGVMLLSRPAFLVIVIGLLVAINVFVFTNNKSQKPPVAVTQNGEQLFASDYNMNETSIYEQTTTEP